MKKLLIIAFVIIGLGANAQNLVSNPSFEEMLIPEYDAKHWGGVFYEYFNTHHFEEELRVPNVNDSVKGTPFGDGFVAFSPFHYDGIHKYVEYLEGLLTAPLIVGHKYKLSFYYCSSGREALDLKILDAYLGGDNWYGTLSGNPRDKGVYPTITFNLINNGVWNKAEGTFVARKKQD